MYLLRLKTKNSYFQNYKQIFVLSLWLIRFKKYNKSYYSFFSRFQDIVRFIHVRHLKNFLLNDLICHKKLFISLKILIFRSTFIKTLLNTIFLFRKLKSFSILQSNTIFSIPGSALRLSPHSDVVFHLRDHWYAGTYLSIGQNPVYFIQGIIPIISVLTSRIRNLMKISKRKKKKKTYRKNSLQWWKVNIGSCSACGKRASDIVYRNRMINDNYKWVH